MDLLRDSIFVISSFSATSDSGLNLYNTGMNCLTTIGYSQEVGHIVWDVKTISVIDELIFVGYTFTGRVEVIKPDGVVVHKFNTGEQLIDLDTPDFEGTSARESQYDVSTFPSGSGFAGIQPLDQNHVIFPVADEDGYDIYLSDYDGNLQGHGFVEGTFQHISVIGGKLYLYQPKEQEIRIYSVGI